MPSSHFAHFIKMNNPEGIRGWMMIQGLTGNSKLDENIVSYLDNKKEKISYHLARDIQEWIYILKMDEDTDED